MKCCATKPRSLTTPPTRRTIMTTTTDRLRPSRGLTALRALRTELRRPVAERDDQVGGGPAGGRGPARAM